MVLPDMLSRRKLLKTGFVSPAMHPVQGALHSYTAQKMQEGGWGGCGAYKVQNFDIGKCSGWCPGLIYESTNINHPLVATSRYC